MIRWLLSVVFLLGSVVPRPQLQAGCRRQYVAPVVQSVQVQTVNTFTELLVPVALVSFQYLTPVAETGRQVAANVAPPATASYAADPFDGAEAHGLQSVGVSAGVLQSRCYSCHGAASRGGVGLFGTSGPTRSGVPLPKSRLWEVVTQGRMPPGQPLTSAEKEALALELLK
jgi:hypothetical protein